MKFLLDAHVLLWWLNNSTTISKEVFSVISNKNNLILISIATLWEIHIKHGLGRLEIPNDFHEKFSQNQIKIIGIELHHLDKYSQLALIHRDPFDRMIVAQALAEDLTIITRDSEIIKYNVPILYA